MRRRFEGWSGWMGPGTHTLRPLSGSKRLLLGTCIPFSCFQYHLLADKRIWKSVPIGSIADYVTLTLLRVAILLFYQQIFSVGERFRRISLAIMIISRIWTAVCILAIMFICDPVSHFWDRLGHGRCLDYMLFFLVTEVVETAMDLFILVMPIPMMAQLTLPLHSRISIIGIFMLGAL